jgi:hypothetical protein
MPIYEGNRVSIDSLSNAVKGIEPQTDALAVTFASDHYDEKTRALNIVDYEHHEIHGGSHYFISGFEIEAEDGTIIFGVTTPNSLKYAHMLFQVSGTSQTEIYIYEGSTITGGASSTPINNNRNSSNTSVLTLVKDPTVNANGTLIFSSSKGLKGTTPARADVEGLESRNKEIILKANTIYTFQIVSKDDDNIITYIGEWYEHTDKSNS